MGTRPYQTTNEALNKVKEQLTELIGWADADAEHAAENDAPDTARDDRARAKLLRKALAIVDDCYR